VNPEWEYHVESLGGALRGAKEEEMQRLLNLAAQEGWEPLHIFPHGSSGGRYWVVLRRRLEASSSRRKRERGWP
jgi:hypothetical protein